MILAALLFLFNLSCSLSHKTELRTIIEEMNVGEDKNFVFNKSVEYIVVIPVPPEPVIAPLRIQVECRECNKDYPAFIIIKQTKGVTSFRLPDVVQIKGGEVSYEKLANTLCPFENTISCDGRLKPSELKSNESTLNDVIVSLSTVNEKDVKVNMMASQVTDFTLQLNDNRTIHLTPSTPYLYFYEFPPGDKFQSIFIKMESDTDSCMEIILYNKSCPLQGELNGGFYYETVTKLGGVTVTNEKFPQGFLAMFSLLPDDMRCTHTSTNTTDRSKKVEISIRESLAIMYYLRAILVTVAVVAVIYVVILSVSFWTMRKMVVPQEQDDIHIIHFGEPSTSATVLDAPSNDEKLQSPYSPSAEDTLSISTDSSLDENEVDTLTDATFDKKIIRLKTALRLSDLAKKNPLLFKKRSNLYFMGLLTVFVFYAVPAAQLVGFYQYNVHEYGNADICYYNSLCSHPWGGLMDFNHIFSNLGYVAFGLLFTIVTVRKEQMHKELVSLNKNLDKHYGVPEHFGLYHAMGMSLTLEGVMSAFYHICPNSYNFQFDVTFMYIISTLCMVKIYQSRHPDINASAHSTFFLMASVLGLSLLGFGANHPSVWGIFIVLHMIVCIYISANIYYVGVWNLNIQVMKRYWRECRLNVHSIWPDYPARFTLLAIMNFFNLALDVVSLLLGGRDFMSLLLIILIVNLILYTTFYIIMKLISKERILLQPLLYIILAFLSWIAALYYFYYKTISWKRTPAESKVFNKPCELLEFYDNHDIWHFLSAAGLFFSFMVLLTLDDDLIFVNRCKIAVF